MTDEAFLETHGIVRRLSRAEAAQFLAERGYQVSVATLGKYACTGGGPVYEKFGRRPLYTEKGLLEWAQGRTSPPRRHSSDLGEP